MTKANVATWNRAAETEDAKTRLFYRLTIQRGHVTFGITTPDVTHALDFICEHENENIYLEIL